MAQRRYQLCIMWQGRQIGTKIVTETVEEADLLLRQWLESTDWLELSYVPAGATRPEYVRVRSEFLADYVISSVVM